MGNWFTQRELVAFTRFARIEGMPAQFAQNAHRNIYMTRWRHIVVLDNQFD